MVKNSILNNDQIKNRNRLAVLSLLRDRGAMSRSELTGFLGCDGTTITNITRSLAADNLIKSGGNENAAGRGRPKELIKLNENSRKTAGIAFSPRFLSGVVVNFVGDIISQEKIYLENRLSRKLFKEHILRLGSSLLKQCPDEVFSGLGLATFGVYHPESKSIIQAEYLNAACNINFEKFFKEEFNIVPDIIDGTSARGVAESWRVKTKSFNSFIVINAGIGIGCFVKLDSGPLLTNRGSYNEFGHMIIKPEGELCEMGHRGCVESYAAIPALEKKLCLIEKRKTINIEEIISRYHDADAIVAEVVNVSAEYLGIAAANLINIFAPEAVIIGGKIAEFGSSYLEVLKSTIRKNAISDFSKNLTCLLSEIKEEGPAWGAALTQLDKLFSGN